MSLFVSEYSNISDGQGGTGTIDMVSGLSMGKI
jgi:hypothetical protein